MKFLPLLLASLFTSSSFGTILHKDFYPQLIQNGITDNSEMNMLGDHMLKELIVKTANADAFIDLSDETEPLSGEFYIKTKKTDKKIGFNFKETIDGIPSDCFFIYGKQEKLCLSSKIINNRLIFTSKVIPLIDLKKYMPIGIVDINSMARITSALVQTCNQLTRRFNRVETPFFSGKADPNTVLINIAPMERPTFQTIENCFYDPQQQIAIQRTALTTDQEVYNASQFSNPEEKQKALNRIFGEE